MDTVAYTLREQYKPDSETPFTGGLVSIGGDDFDIGAKLDAGGGVIVVRGDDYPLIGLLDVYPALERVDHDASPADVISPYERRTDEAIAHLGSLRDVAGADEMDRDALASTLDRLDAAQVAGDTETIAEITAADPPAGPQGPPVEPVVPPTTGIAGESIATVIARVGDDVAAATSARAAEQARGNDARSTLIEQLDRIIDNEGA